MHAALLALTMLVSAASQAEARRPVMVELFSSEGCSSCPAADAVLAELDRDQPIPGVEVIALELHVDYWNRLGWTDPFSSEAFTARQEAYARAMEKRGLYTPQAVVDGAGEIVGSDSPGLRRMISRAAAGARVAVSLAMRDGMLAASVKAPGARGSVWLAITERGLSTQVPRGENAGRRLVHGPVVRKLTRLGELRDGSFSASLDATLPAAIVRANARYVVFVQEEKSLHVLGAAAIAAP